MRVTNLEGKKCKVKKTKNDKTEKTSNEMWKKRS